MRPGRWGDDGGAATTEFVIAAPAFLFVIMLIVQAGLYFHAVSVASAAAQDGARAASLEGATPADGERVAGDLVHRLAPKLISDAHAKGERLDGGQVMRMTVTGHVSEVFVLPGGHVDLTVTETAERNVEVFRPANEPPPHRGQAPPPPTPPATEPPTTEVPTTEPAPPTTSPRPGGTIPPTTTTTAPPASPTTTAPPGG